MKHDLNVSPYLLRPPMTHEQAMRLWAEQDRARSTVQERRDGDDAQATVRRPGQSLRASKCEAVREIDDA